MGEINEGVDALSFSSGGTTQKSRGHLGGIPGVRIDRVAGRCPTGQGELRSFGDGTEIAYKPAGGNYGPSLTWSSGQKVLLGAGVAGDEYIVCEIYTAYLLKANAGRLDFREQYNNLVASDDVTAAEATAGDVSTYTIDVQNDGSVPVYGVRVWLDPTVSGIEISDDGAVWVNPTTEASALNLGTLAASASATLHLRRTISPGATADPAVPVVVLVSFERF